MQRKFTTGFHEAVGRKEIHHISDMQNVMMLMSTHLFVFRFNLSPLLQSIGDTERFLIGNSDLFVTPVYCEILLQKTNY